jgi:hypothetical protein
MMTSADKTEEMALRERLGVPPDAKHVLIFSESSHWDPNWLWTSSDYFEKLVRPNLDQAIAALLREPRRVYSVECMYFLRMYWEACPHQHENLRALINNRQLRITNSGVTTADTILPSAEAILRDLLQGQEWLREQGLQQEPTLAYFTDSFGMSPALPSLLQAAGFDRTAFTRIDGMYFMGSDFESGKHYPRAHSSAEFLMNEKSLDFVWKDMNGAQVLAHWNAFTYGQGDMLAHKGLMRMYIMPLAVEARSDRHVARRIQSFADALLPLSKTPYLFCPIGFDFVAPIEELIFLLDRYNHNHYAESGIWAVNAGLDDYLALVENHTEHLPVFEMDPNPYWTGFYTARPLLKQRAYELTNDLLLAEQLSLQPASPAQAQDTAQALAPAWWLSAVSNHHDFITGTSPDEVIYGESFPMLAQATAEVQSILTSLQATEFAQEKAKPIAALPQYTRNGDVIIIATPHYTAEISERLGGAITSLRTPAGVILLNGPSNDLVSYRDSGGLWRMGLEYQGGTWKETARASDAPAPVAIEETAAGLALHTTLTLNGETIQRTMWFRADSPLLRCRVSGKAAAGTTINVRLRPEHACTRLHMDAAGGVVSRPPQRVYDPTFWPFQHFAHLCDERAHGLAILQRHPGAVACLAQEKQVELVALRNATKEKAYGFIGLPANPAKGHVKEPYDFDYALQFTHGGDWQENGLPLLAEELFSAPTAPPLFTSDQPLVRVAAVKTASRGEGIILRLQAPAVPSAPVQIRAHSIAVQSAQLCDVRERDIAPLAVVGDTITLTMTGTIATIRIIS